MKFLILSLFISLPALALKAKDGKVILEKLSDYSQCQTADYQGTWCQAALNDWVEKNPSDAWAAAKLTRKQMNSWVALPLFYKAAKAQKPDCKDEDLSMAVVDALNQPKSGNEELISQAKEIGFKLCPEMKDAIAKEANVGTPLFENACGELVKAGSISGLKKAKCKSL